MDEITAFSENFYSTASMLGGNRGGYITVMPSGSLVAMTGLPYAGENYALFRQGASPCEVAEAIDIFSCRAIPFTVPQFPEIGAELAARLEANRLFVHKHYTAMVLGRDDKFDKSTSPNVVKTEGKELEREWAEAAWQGFGGENTDESYCEFASYLNSRAENTLFTYREDGRSVACGLLHTSQKACGLYYFATVPAYRRRGIAAKLLAVLAKEAFEKRELFVLLATEEGLPVYTKFGFRPLFGVPIRSSVREI